MRVRCRSVAPASAASVQAREATPGLAVPMFHSARGRGWCSRAAPVSWSRRAGEQAAFHSAAAAEQVMAAEQAKAAALALAAAAAAAALLAAGLVATATPIAAELAVAP